MTEEEARRVKDPTALPWNTPCCVFVPGRYYLGMWFVSIPPSHEIPFGGNLLMQCWRYEATPLDWKLILCVRYYADASGEVWKSQDRKSWHFASMSADEAAAEKNIAHMIAEMSGVIGLLQLACPPKVHSLIFKCGCEDALKIIAEKKPFWMHTKLSHE